MEKQSETHQIGLPPFSNDPLVLKAYSEALKQKQKWQTAIDGLIREVLGVPGYQTVDLSKIPSAEEIRNKMTRHIPEDKKLSDSIIAMREE